MTSATVADVLAAALARSGTRALFARRVRPPLLAAAGRHRLAVFPVDGAGDAALLAAGAGELTGAPGVAVLGGRDPSAAVGVRYAALQGAPVIVVAPAADEVPPGGTKAIVEVGPESAGEAVGAAVRAALAPPRGPVGLVVADERLADPTPAAMPELRPAPAPLDPVALAAAAERLAASERPVLVVGLEARAPGAPAWVRALAEALPAPVVVTAKARGVVPDGHPLAFPLEAEATGALLARADLVLTVGLGPAERGPAPWPPGASVVHVGTTPAPGATLALVGDVMLGLEELAPRLRGRARADWDVGALERLRRSAASAGRRARWGAPEERVTRVVALVRARMPARAVATASGWPAAAVAAGWPAAEPSDLLLATGGEPPGFALLAATAAALAFPERAVVAFTDARVADEAALAVVARLARPLLVAAVAGPGTAGDGARARPGGLTVLEAEDEQALVAALDRARALGRPALIEARVVDS